MRVVAVAEGVDLWDVGRESLGGQGLQVFSRGLVPLVTHHHLYVVHAKYLVEVEGLHIVLTHGVGRVLVDIGIIRRRGSVEGVAVNATLTLCDVDVVVRVELQPAGQVEIEGEGTGEHIGDRLSHVVLVGTDGVTSGEEQTGTVAGEVGCRHTVVILLMSVLVGANHGIAICIECAHVERIDWCDHRGVVSHVVRAQRTDREVGVLFHVAVHKAHIGAYAEPFLSLIVGLHATGEALVVGVVDDTVFVQVAGRSIEAALRGTTTHVDVILLTEAVMVGSVLPVVGQHVVGLTAIDVGATERSIGVELAIQTDEILSCRNGEGVVLQAPRLT